LNILSIDFNELYKTQKLSSDFKPKTKEEWDAKAEDLNKRIHQSIYNEQFLSAVNTSGCESLLDIGCGPGNLAIRFAKKLPFIHAVDYSSEMLKCLNENAITKKIVNITTHQLSWDDNWDNLPQTDIVIASRSMEVPDMKEALLKLDNQAKKRVYLTYKVGGSFLDLEMMDIIGKKITPKPDYIYIINILYSMGINAKVEFLESENSDKNITSYEELLKRVEWSIGALDDEQKLLLKEYFGSGKKPKANKLAWALIYWEK
jgi:SAM-dependent methyltransferase